MPSSFQRAVQNWIGKVDIAVDVLTKRTAFKVLNGCAERTPVDTGRARASWNMVVGRNPDLSVQPEDYKANKEQALNTALSTGRSLENARVYTVSNNLDYIIWLEEGTSKMKPHHMAKLAVADAVTELKINVR